MKPNLINFLFDNIKTHLLILVIIFIYTPDIFAQNSKANIISHVEVFKEEGRFAGWPANHGIWSWGDEILVRFNVGWLEQKGKNKHAYNSGIEGPEYVWARSLDGGVTWKVDERESAESRKKLRDNSLSYTPSLSEQPRNFLQPDFALFMRGANWRYSTDRGHSWKGLYTLPESDVPLYATNHYLIDGPHSLTSFVEQSNHDSIPSEKSPIHVFRTEDAGTNWKLISKIGKTGSEGGYILRPSVVRVSSTEIVVATRRKKRIEIYKSTDNGITWTHIGTPVKDSASTTPNLFGLDNGSLVLIYGFRVLGTGNGIRAKISNDSGKTWGDEFILKGDAGNWDIGYPLTVRRLDGKLVTIYYFNEDSVKERYIEATIWEAYK